VVGPEALERAVDRLPHVLRRPIQPAERGHVAADDAIHLPLELGRDHVFVPLTLDRLADQLLVGQWAIDLGGVDEVDAELERASDCCYRFRLVGGAVEGRHAHAAEAEG
jgi:hypothetical protein